MAHSGWFLFISCIPQAHSACFELCDEQFVDCEQRFWAKIEKKQDSEPRLKKRKDSEQRLKKRKDLNPSAKIWI